MSSVIGCLDMETIAERMVMWMRGADGCGEEGEQQGLWLKMSELDNGELALVNSNEMVML